MGFEGLILDLIPQLKNFLSGKHQGNHFPGSSKWNILINNLIIV